MLKMRVCQLLLRVIQAAPHQQSELGFELSVLFLSRRKLQEMNQSQILTVRKKKTGQVDIRRASLGVDEGREGGRGARERESVPASSLEEVKPAAKDESKSNGKSVDKDENSSDEEDG